MKEERLYVLNLISEGKITAEEAATLLAALGKKPRKEPADDDVSFEERLKKFQASAAAFAKDVGTKAESTYKDMEPKVKKTTMAAALKTASVIDDVSKSLRESLDKMQEKSAEATNEEAAETAGEEPAEAAEAAGEESTAAEAEQ